MAGLKCCSLVAFVIINCVVLSAVADEYHPSHFSESSARSKRQAFGNEQENHAEFWMEQAQRQLENQLTKELNFNVAKNVIMFLGDGMSIPTLAAARAYAGKLNGAFSGEETHLFFDDFPHTGLSKTYCVDKQVADSACSATAYLCGVKANYGTVGVTAAVPNNNCTASNDRKNHVSSIARWAQKAGKGTGIVTTSRVTHASPSGTFANVANREWECDADVAGYNNDPRTCDDIARQLVYGETGQNFKVIFGGGRQKFLPKSFKFLNGESGQRNDGANLIKEWLQQKKKNAKFVYDRKGLSELDYNTTEYVLGLFESSHMKFHLDSTDSQPTLAEMTEAAIKMMRKEPKGYFLFVEGARIDHGHHESKAAKALDETVQLSEAVRKAVEMTDQKDTLIVVTSDHAHTMTMSGYSQRGNNVLGLNTEISDMDSKPYTTLNYANGPGYKEAMIGSGRYDLVNDTFSKDYEYPSSAPLSSETHGGDDVGVFALGPWSHLFTGVYEQNLIPHVMAYASCIGEGMTACWLPKPQPSATNVRSGATGNRKVDTSVKILH